MTISSMQTYLPSLLEPKEHSGGCQCPGCCKKSLETSDASGIEKSNKTKDKTSDAENTKVNKSDKDLNASEQQQVTQLQQRDSEVRAHEAAHIAAGGAVVSGAASFTYQKGPDGKLYAVGGEVAISTSGGNTPEEKIAIAQQIQAGALAPANPSPQDLKVASSAAVMEAKARQELSLQNQEELKEKAVNTYAQNQGSNDAEEQQSKLLA